MRINNRHDLGSCGFPKRSKPEHGTSSARANTEDCNSFVQGPLLPGPTASSSRIRVLAVQSIPQRQHKPRRPQLIQVEFRPDRRGTNAIERRRGVSTKFAPLGEYHPRGPNTKASVVSTGGQLTGARGSYRDQSPGPTTKKNPSFLANPAPTPPTTSNPAPSASWTTLQKIAKQRADLGAYYN
jgi:hypothetical protein